MAKVSQNISSESLFHFIKRKEWLFEILNNKAFQARYVYEDLLEFDYKVGIPMKCFCDIPLGLIKKHLNKYGKFGIGIQKSFAKEMNLSPVIYVHARSDTYYRYITTMDADDIFSNSLSLFPYFKVDMRETKTPEGKKIVDRYYDEREWRFIPPRAKFIDFSGFDEEEIYKTRLSHENKKLQANSAEYALPFVFENITYIFVQFEKDIDSVIAEIRKLKIKPIQQDRLIAKIITSRQIERDF